MFPNNWFSTHKDGNIPKGVFFTYPMKVPSRQREINPDIITEIGANYKKMIPLKAARKGESLEGTGSLVIDSRLRKIYCCMSERADFNTLIKFSMKLSKLAKQSYELVSFSANDQNGTRIYHTNVMLAMLDKHAICCLESIESDHDRENLKKHLTQGGREIIDISYKEMGEMCGNMIQLRSEKPLPKGPLCVIMSERAKKGLTKEHLATLQDNYNIIASDISTIETIGGGSARCMVAEIF